MVQKNKQFVVFDSSFKMKLGSGTSSDNLSRALMVSTLGIIDSKLSKHKKSNFIEPV